MVSSQQKSFDVVVVGAGVIGLACAWRAARAGASVVVVDPAEPPAGATLVSAGMLAPVGEVAFGEERLARMTLTSAALWPRFVEELEADSDLVTGFRREGALHVALDRDEAAELRRGHDLQRELGLDAEWLTPTACRKLEPGLAPSIAGGVSAPHEASVDPRRLAAAMVGAIEAAGGELRFGREIANGLLEGEILVGVRTSEGEEIRAGAVVLAAGAWSGSATWLPEEARPPVRPVKGEILELGSPDGRAVCERILASERVYLVPRSDGRLIAGATVGERGFDESVSAGGVHELLREAYRLLPDVAELDFLGAAAGLRPGTPDNLPIVGHGAINGLVLATGHFRNGVLLAPLTGEAVARLIAGSGVPEEMADAAPGRFESCAGAVTPEPMGAVR